MTYTVNVYHVGCDKPETWGTDLNFRAANDLFDHIVDSFQHHWQLYCGQNIYVGNSDNENQTDFRNFVNKNYEFNPHNMFICKSKTILISYYSIVFPWLQKCENIFGFEKLKGYDLTRIYGFLAERFLSYWFQKNTKFSTLPITFLDKREIF